MPITKASLTRLQILDKLLANQTIKYNYDSLLDAVNEQLRDLDKCISRRTLLYDLENIELEFGDRVTVLRTPETFHSKDKIHATTQTWVRYEDPHSTIFKNPMTDEESYLLRQTLKMLGDFEGLPSLERLEELRGGSQSAQGMEPLVVMESSCLENKPFFGVLFAAITAHKPVEIHHHKFDAPEIIIKHFVYPYQLREYNNRWYVIGCTRMNGKPNDELWPYRLDSIDDVVIRTDVPYHLAPESIVDHFEDIVGVTRIKGKPCQRIVFWVSEPEFGYVDSKPIHGSQTQVKGEEEALLRTQNTSLNGGKYYSIECMENYELIRELSSFGPHLVVVAPDNIRKSIMSRIRTMMERYDQSQESSTEI